MSVEDGIEYASRGSEETIAPLPRVAIQVFCESAAVAATVQDAAADRRMSKAHVKIQMGGARAAVEAYRQAPTPNLIVIESPGDREDLIRSLNLLAEVCDASTKVMVIGHVNDVILYRELMRLGVSEYVIVPIDVMMLIRAMSELFTAPGAEPVGRTIGVIGAKGGVGASTICHNLGWAVTKRLDLSAVIADLDVPFGTAGLDFNQDPPQGIADALFTPDRIDSAFIDRLLSKCSDKLSLLAAPAVLDRVCDFNEAALDPITDLLRGSVPCVLMDVPHVWTGWSRRALIGCDEIVIVAEPELASLRNAKNLYDTLSQARPNDSRPHVLLNKVGIAKRPEIAPADFGKALGAEPAAIIPFDAALFGSAANNGQMIAEIQPNGKITELFAELGGRLMGRAEPRKTRRTLLDPILARFSKAAS